MNQTFNDTYEIQSQIGKGGMSNVYVAVHKRLHTRWAVKQVSKNQGEKFDFLAEANILKNLQHPMLPRIVDIFEDDDSIYIVEDFVEGITLEKWLEKHTRADEKTGAGWFADLCGVLQYLHTQERPIIYRDMKPSNIMLQPDGTLKLIDFGIAREYKNNAQGDTAYIGTQGYAAPEQFGTAQTDERTDIYSLGVTMYHVLTGKSPYEPPYQFVPARELNPSLSAGIEQVLSHCLKPEPDDRYPNVTALAEDLEHRYRYDRVYRKYVRTKRLRVALIVGLLLISGGMIGGGKFLMLQEEANQQAAVDRQYEQLIDSAAELLATDPESAWDVIAEARELRPQRVESYRQEALALYEAGKYEDCVTFTASQLKSFPGDSELLQIQGSASYELGDYETAVDCFYQSAQNSDMSADILRDYAVCLGRVGRIEEAEEVLNQLTSTGGDSASTDYVHGEVLYAKQDYSGAEQYFLSALQASDSDDLTRRCYLSLAQVYRDNQEYDKSISLIEEALANPVLQGNSVLHEMLGAAYYNRGSAQNQKEDLQKAAQEFEQVIQTGMAKEYLYINAFTAWQSIGEYEKAGSVLDSMETAWPESYIPHALRAMLMIMVENTKAQSQRDYQPAYTEYEKARELVRDNDEQSYLQQLEGLIDQLKAGNWL